MPQIVVLPVTPHVIRASVTSGFKMIGGMRVGKARVQLWRMARLKQRKLVWFAVGVAELMFFVELIAGLFAMSSSLQVDALSTSDLSATTDPMLNSKLLTPRQEVIGAMAASGLVFVACLWSLGLAVWNIVHDKVPNATIMAAAGGIALIANATAASLLYRNRVGSVQAKSAWVAARNDTLGNLCVVVAAACVYATKTSWPDAVATVVLAPFALRQGVLTVERARIKLRGIAAEEGAQQNRLKHQRKRHLNRR